MKIGYPGTPQRPAPAKSPQADGDELAVEALRFIGTEPDLTSRFLQSSGLDVGSLRSAAADPDFLSGVVDYLLSDDEMLIAFATATGRSPAAIVEVLRRRHPPALDGSGW